MTQSKQKMNALQTQRIITTDMSERIRSQDDDPLTMTDRILGGLVGATLFGFIYWLAVKAVSL